MKSKFLIIAGMLLVALSLVLAACQTSPAPAPTTEATPCPTAEPCPDCPACPDCPECPEPVVENVPFEEMWANSPHNDTEAEAFVHWNEDDPAEIPESCAKCHSTTGYLDFLGEDGSAFGEVNAAAPIGETVQCVACHNETTAQMTSVVFPSGVEITGMDASARCAQCHQGRASAVQVNASIEEAGLTDQPDEVGEALGFINIHYYAAAATLYGAEVQGGYQYEGQAYTPRFDHVEDYDSCIGCHNSHTLELKIEECQVCHQGVASVEDIANIRMASSQVDYDGDGDLEEGIKGEITTLQEYLYAAIQAYASEVAGTPIVYNQASHPYFFIDSDGDGEATDADSERYASWTPRLLKAAYNYQVTLKDPGAYAHNGKYMIQLLHDSINDLNESIATPIDLSMAVRNDPGHFAAETEAFRHWDEDGMVPGTCAKCHSAVGLPVFLANGTNIAVEPSSGLNCATCHDNLAEFTIFTVESVTFPSGATVAFADSPQSNLCLNCHQGRESTVSVNRAIAGAGVGDDEVSEALRFRNPHYFAAGATLFGTEVQGAYEYEGQQYNGRFPHVANFDTCTECHDPHGLTVNATACAACHPGADQEGGLEAIRISTEDFDGDGDTTEGMAGEVEGMQERLYEAIQAYGEANGSPIEFNPASYPYWFDDAGESYAQWTPALLRAAYNYTWAAKDPGAFAHNGKYMLQVLYDSISALGGDTAGLVRPEVTVAEGEAQ